MTNGSQTGELAPELPESERVRIRAEMRYAMAVAKEGRPVEVPKSALDKALSYLSNGFVLLVIGSLVTTGLVPRFQRAYEARVRRANLMQESFSQFLLYSNSIWQEYYAILPLTQQTDLAKEEYLKYLTQMTEIKLKRYEAYAKVQALALAFREDGNAAMSPVETALRNYAVRLNTASAEIDKWLTGLYCTPTKRDISPCATFDPTFDAFTQYMKIQNLVVEIGNTDTDDVAGLIVTQLRQH
jgi:hypothetical protein